MNIQAVNANPTLGRRQVPRNNVSFGSGIKGQNISNIKDAAANNLKVGKEHLKNGFAVIGGKVVDFAKASKDVVKNALKSAKASVGDFAANNSGVKGIKIAATALTAIVAGGFAIKEVYDIVTKSNPER